MDIRNVISQKWFVPTVIGVTGLGAGFGAGFVYGRRIGWNKAVDMVDEAIGAVEDGVVTMEEVTDFAKNATESIRDILEDETYGDPSKTVSLIEPEESNIQSSETMRLFDGTKVAPRSPVIIDAEVIEHSVVVEEELIQVNVFNSAPEDWDEEAEEANRETGKPYIISKPEFDHNEGEWRQETLTYYKGDDILCGIDDSPIEGYERLTGPLRFGHGSGDPVVVYIRNEAHLIEWEICMNMGRYEIEVLGFALEDEYESNDLRHSADRRFRQE